MYTRLAGTVCCLATAVMLMVSADAVASDRQAEYIQLRLLIGEQKFSEALDRCRILIAKYPDYVYLYETMAEIALYAQDLNGAAKFFEERIEDGTGLELSYFGLGTVYYNMAAYREAALCFDRAIELGIAAPECYRNFVYAYERLEGVDASIRFFNSLCHRNPQNPHLWYAVALAYWSKRDYPVVLKSIEAALARNSHEEKYLQAKAAVLLLNGRSDAVAVISGLISQGIQTDDLNGLQFLRSYLILGYDLSGDSTNAKAYTWTNLEEARKFGLYRWVGWGYERMADYEFLTSDYERCLAYSALAIDASQKCSDNSLLSAALVRQYDSHMELGDFREALESAYSRLSQFNNANAASDSIRAFIDIAWAYHELGDENTAMEYAIESLNKSESSKSNSAMLLRIHSTLGLIYEGLGNFAAASNNFRSSLELIKEDKVGMQNLAILHGNIGRTCLALGQMAKSLSHFTAESRIAREAGFLREEAFAHNHLGRFFLKSGNLLRSNKEFLMAFKLGQKLGQKHVMMESTRGLAEVGELRGNLAEAVSLYKAAIDSCEGIGLLKRYPWTKSSLEKERQDDFRECIRILCRLGRSEEAFLASETSKLYSMLYPATGRHRMIELLPARTANTLVGIEKEILKKRGELASQRESMLSRVGPPSFELTDEIARLEAAYYRTLDAVGLQYPSILNGTRIRAENPSALRRSFLGDHEALLEFSVAETEVNMFLLKKDTLICRSMDIGRTELRRMVSKVSEVLDWEHNRGHLLNATLANFSAKASNLLYCQLVAWCQPYLADVKSLVVVADDILEGFPFESLVCSLPMNGTGHDFGGAQFLLGRFSVRYVQAATMLAFDFTKRASPAKFLLAIGDPRVSATSEFTTRTKWNMHLPAPRLHSMPHLPGAQREVRMIQSLLGSSADIVTKEAASKRMLFAGMKDYRVVHVASHLSVDTQDPLFSCIYLADDPETGDNGVLHGFELLNTEINADLVILSSCNSGQVASDARGRGIVDAFLTAGVPSAVASLWSVDDQSSASLMERFYLYLSQGFTKSVSLQKAKIDLVHSGKADPFYWAGFVLIGDGGPMPIPVSHSQEWSGWLFATSLSTLVVLALLGFWIRRGSPRGIAELLSEGKG